MHHLFVRGFVIRQVAFCAPAMHTDQHQPRICVCIRIMQYIAASEALAHMQKGRATLGHRQTAACLDPSKGFYPPGKVMLNMAPQPCTTMRRLHPSSSTLPDPSRIMQAASASAPNPCLRVGGARNKGNVITPNTQTNHNGQLESKMANANLSAR
jgi:hypothetical protein